MRFLSFFLWGLVVYSSLLGVSSATVSVEQGIRVCTPGSGQSTAELLADFGDLRCQMINGSLTLLSESISLDAWLYGLRHIRSIQGSLSLAAESFDPTLLDDISISGTLTIQNPPSGNITSYFRKGINEHLTVAVRTAACFQPDDLEDDLAEWPLQNFTLSQPVSCTCFMYNWDGVCVSRCAQCPKACGSFTVNATHVPSDAEDYDGCKLMVGDLSIISTTNYPDAQLSSVLNSLESLEVVQGGVLLQETSVVTLSFLRNLQFAKKIAVLDNTRLFDAKLPLIGQDLEIEFNNNPLRCTGRLCDNFAATLLVKGKGAISGPQAVVQTQQDLASRVGNPDARVILSIDTSSSTEPFLLRFYRPGVTPFEAMTAIEGLCQESTILTCESDPVITPIGASDKVIDLIANPVHMAVNFTWQSQWPVSALLYRRQNRQLWEFTEVPQDKDFTLLPLCRHERHDRCLDAQADYHVVAVSFANHVERTSQTVTVHHHGSHFHVIRLQAFFVQPEELVVFWELPGTLAADCQTLLLTAYDADRQFLLRMPVNASLLTYELRVCSGVGDTNCVPTNGTAYMIVATPECDEAVSSEAVIASVFDSTAPQVELSSITSNGAQLKVSTPPFSFICVEIQWSGASSKFYVQLQVGASISLFPLEPDTVYTVRVGYPGVDWISDPVEFTTVSGTPQQVPQPQVFRTVDGKFELRWQRPLFSGNGELIYTVSAAGEPADVLCATTELSCEVSASSMAYIVKGSNTAGSGAFSLPSDTTVVQDDMSTSSSTSDNGAKPFLILLVIVILMLIGLAVYVFRKGKKRSTPYVPPDPDEWELERSHVTFGEQIGHGVSGVVLAGRVKHQGKRTDVAIKLLDAVDDLRMHEAEFLAEADMMKTMNHPNVVELIGICTQSQPILVIIKLCERGDLRGVLRRNRASSEGEEPFSLGQLLCMARDVASGVSYFADKGIIHRDLATRNCLVNDDWSVVISDFGRSKRLQDDNLYYRTVGESLMPVRWMAPEALVDGIFSLESDAWSLGVVLYEIITLGSLPYAELSNQEVCQQVLAGYRLPQPRDCPEDYYKLMFQLWAVREERPLATYVSLTVQNMLLNTRAAEVSGIRRESLAVWEPVSGAEAVVPPPMPYAASFSNLTAGGRSNSLNSRTTEMTGFSNSPTKSDVELNGVSSGYASWAELKGGIKDSPKVYKRTSAGTSNVNVGSTTNFRSRTTSLPQTGLTGLTGSLPLTGSANVDKIKQRTRSAKVRKTPSIDIQDSDMIALDQRDRRESYARFLEIGPSLTESNT